MPPLGSFRAETRSDRDRSPWPAGPRPPTSREQLLAGIRTVSPDVVRLRLLAGRFFTRSRRSRRPARRGGQRIVRARGLRRRVRGRAGASPSPPSRFRESGAMTTAARRRPGKSSAWWLTSILPCATDASPGALVNAMPLGGSGRAAPLLRPLRRDLRRRGAAARRLRSLQPAQLYGGRNAGERSASAWPWGPDTEPSSCSYSRQGALLVGVGTAMGLLAAAVATRIVESILFGVTPADPLTFATVTAGAVCRSRRLLAPGAAGNTDRPDERPPRGVEPSQVTVTLGSASDKRPSVNPISRCRGTCPRPTTLPCPPNP